MSVAFFNDTIHAPIRLQVCAMLDAMSEIEFRVLKDTLNVSDSVMSKHLKVLDEAGYLNVSKRNLDGRQRTWLSLSPLGRGAYLSHVRALKKILNPV